jgi:hypothetical protein
MPAGAELTAAELLSEMSKKKGTLKTVLKP